MKRNESLVKKKKNTTVTGVRHEWNNVPVHQTQDQQTQESLQPTASSADLCP